VIGIFAALQRELKPIAACLANLDEFQESGVRFSVGHLNRATVVLVQTGIGWTRALSAAQIAAARFPLRLYISTGFAGALQDSIRVGDLVIGEKIFSLLPGGPGKAFVCDEAFTQSAGTAAKAFPGGVFCGSLVTVGQIVGRAEDKKSIAGKSGAIALDMETAAVAGVADQRRISFIAVRAVSDTLDENLGFDASLLLTDGGGFRWWSGIRYLACHPAALSHLNRLRRQSNLAARSLGLFFQEFLPSLSLN